MLYDDSHMRSLLIAIPLLSLAACGAGADDTSPGVLTSAHSSGGFCQTSAPWCGWDLVVSGDTLTLDSQGTADSAVGSLTTAGHDELAALVAALPIDTASDTSQTCADAPTMTLDITFETGGAHMYSYACTTGAFTDLGGFVDDVSGALISGQSNGHVVIAETLAGH